MTMGRIDNQQEWRRQSNRMLLAATIISLMTIAVPSQMIRFLFNYANKKPFSSIFFKNKFSGVYRKLLLVDYLFNIFLYCRRSLETSSAHVVHKRSIKLVVEQSVGDPLISS